MKTLLALALALLSLALRMTRSMRRPMGPFYPWIRILRNLSAFRLSARSHILMEGRVIESGVNHQTVDIYPLLCSCVSQLMGPAYTARDSPNWVVGSFDDTVRTPRYHRIVRKGQNHYRGSMVYWPKRTLYPSACLIDSAMETAGF